MNPMDCAQFLRPNSGRFHPDHTAEAGSGSQGIAADAELFPPGVIVSVFEITFSEMPDLPLQVLSIYSYHPPTEIATVLR